MAIPNKKAQVSPIEVSIDNQRNQFLKFIQPKENERIVFSGIFGIGKTYFLKNFFDSVEIKQDYIGLHIYPSNYSVSSNEDIFEYIKYDLFYELLSKKVELEKNTVSPIQAIFLLSGKEQYFIFKKFLSMIGRIGKPVSLPAELTVDTLEAVESTVNSLEAKAKQVSINEFDTIRKYREKMSSKVGSIYENDIYTELITELISRLKLEGKQIVLVVDDLDRIDPEHIFRILNVFAVHFDVNEKGNKNKFNLDKIILSCDITNIRNMFAARYGANADFNGYVDKFYSKRIYHFDNTKFIAQVVKDVIMSCSYNDKFGGNNYPEQRRDLIIMIIASMIKSNCLSLRTLKRMQYEKFEFDGLGLDLNKAYPFKHAICLIFEILFFLFESTETLRNVIERTRFNSIDNFITKLFFPVNVEESLPSEDFKVWLLRSFDEYLKVRPMSDLLPLA